MQIFEIVTDDTLRATTQHGTPAFPFEYYFDEIKKFKGQCIEWHWHDEFEFTSVISGPVDCLIGITRITLNSGDGLFINSGAIHRFESPGKGVMVNILFSPEFVASKTTVIYKKFIKPLLADNCKYVVFNKDDEKQKHLLEILKNIYLHARKQHQMRELQIHILIASLWEEFFQGIQNELVPRKENNKKVLQARLQIMLDFIHRHYREHIGLDAIAAAASISKSEALRCFHFGVQTTPVNYLNEYRLNSAKEKLASTSDTVSSVAWNSGFESVGYFCRVFKKRYKLTPEAFRKQYWLNK